MKDLDLFQLVVLIVFGIAAVLAVLIFSGVIPGFGFGQGAVTGTALLWGPLPQQEFDELIKNFKSDEIGYTIAYEYHDPRSFETELINALARGSGPDLVLITQEMLLPLQGLIMPLPLDQVSERQFRDTFVEGAELLWDPAGAWGLPLAIDPLVLYYNRDRYTAAGIAQAPRTWSELLTIVPLLTRKSSEGVLTQSAIALGEYANVTHAKEVLSLLFVQAGNKVVARDAQGLYQATLSGAPSSKEAQSSTAALQFYTQFTDPLRVTHSWDASRPASRDAFSAGTLASYLGFGSERAALTKSNPHLNFDIALVPQRNVEDPRTYGRVYALAALKSSRNLPTAFAAQNLLTGGSAAPLIERALGLPSARRASLAAAGGLDATLRRSALIARAWLDPSPEQSARIFATMVQLVNVGQSSPADALKRANDELAQLLKVRR